MKFTAADVERMIALQRTFYFSGETKSVQFRKQQLQKLKASIQQHEQQIMEALRLDLGKSEFEAYTTEVGMVYESISYMLKHVERWMKPQSVKTPFYLQPAKSFIVREPYGVTLIVAPFNYPFQLSIEPLIGAIVGGNTAIIKPSEATVHTTKVIKKVIEHAFPPEYVRVVEGEKDEVTALIYASFDYIFFTGSVAVGKVIMRAAAERLTPHTLELGGKSPAIVDQTAHLAIAAKRIVWGKFTNAGQTCIAPDYVLVHRSVKDKFVQLLEETIRHFYGHDIQQNADFGRIVNERQFDRLQQILEREQAQIVFGGQMDREQLFIHPTIVTDVTWQSPSMEEELFGPILPIMTFDHLPTAVREVRQLAKPLAAYLFSEDEPTIQHFLTELPFGGGCINDTITHIGNPHLPFGGVGPSGVKSYHGKASFENFTHPKSIMRKSNKLAIDLIYPPYKDKIKLIKKLLK